MLSLPIRRNKSRRMVCFFLFWFLVLVPQPLFGSSSLSQHTIVQDSSRSANIGTVFTDMFNGREEIIEEADVMNHSSSPYWWLNSGARFIIHNGMSASVQRNLSRDSYWRRLYSSSNAEDTDDGKHPQNIFRLLTRSTWKNQEQHVLFRVDRTVLSSSSNRNESNGVLLFSRYEDSNTLYYAGLRVDGAAVIKKKYHGVYTTLAYKKILSLSQEYDVVHSPNLIPTNTWIGIKSRVINTDNGGVHLTLYVDLTHSGQWEQVLDIVDEPTADNIPITSGGYAGIRTDFMDVRFDDYRINSI